MVLDGDSMAMTQAAAVSKVLTSMRSQHSQNESSSLQLQQLLEEVKATCGWGSTGWHGAVACIARRMQIPGLFTSCQPTNGM